MKTTKPANPKTKKTPTASAAEGRQRYAWIIFLFSSFIYLNSVVNDYNLDDELVTQNHRLTSKGISAIPEIFTSPYYEDNAGYKYEYRPVVLVTFAMEHSLFGDNPHISHLINVLLYGLLCVLLFQVLQLMFANYKAQFALLVALLFAVHPIHTEVVASIKNRDEILALMFCLLALRLSLYYAANGKWWHLLLIPVVYVLGILSKSTAIPFAFLIPLTLVCLTGCKPGKLFWITLVLAVPTVLYARLYSVTQQIALLLALFAAVFALYGIKHIREIRTRLKQLFQNTRTGFTLPASDVAPVEEELDTTFYKRPLFLVVLFPLILLLMTAGMLGVYGGQFWLTSLPLAALVALYWWGRIEVKAVLQLPIAVIAGWLIARSNTQTAPLMALVISFLFVNSMSRVKAVKLQSYIYLVVSAVVFILLFKRKLFFMSLVVLLFVFRQRKWRPVTVVIAVLLGLTFVAFLVKLYLAKKVFGLLIFVIPSVLMCAFLYQKERQPAAERVALLSLLLLVMLSFYVSPITPRNLTSDMAHAYSQAKNVQATDLTPVQSVRPLKYIEYPLQNTDKTAVKLGTALVILGEYFKKILIPYPMAFYYGYAYIVPVSFFTAVPIIIALLYAGLVIIALYFLYRIPELAYGILFFLAAITVFSNLFIPIPGMMGDRFLLIPSIGYSVVLVSLLGLLFRVQWERPVLLTAVNPKMKWVLGALLLSASVLTMARNADWKDRITLFRKDIKVVDNSAQAQNLLALHLFIASNSASNPQQQLQMREEAVTHFKRSLEIYPDFLNPSYDLARTYEAMGKFDEAYQAYANTCKLDTTFYAPYFSMAVILDNQGKVSEAIPLYEKYLVKYPYRKEVYANLSFAYFKLKQYDRSIAVNRKLLALQPDTYEPTVNIAKTYLQIGQKDSAYVYFKKTDAIRPGDQNVRGILEQLRQELGLPQ